MVSLIEKLKSELVDAAAEPAGYDIATYPADFTLQILNDKLKSGEIQIPGYQRKFVWKMPQSGRLIESFLLGLPVPPIYLYAEKDTEALLVVDGQQRLRSVNYFFEGFFGEESKGKRPVFRLSTLNDKSPWYNKTFADLEATDEPSARRLRNQVLRSFIIRQLNPKDDTSVYHIFDRLNTGGALLKGQEIRNCVYHGTLNETLISLNGDPNWRAIFGSAKPDNRMRDVELVLRFLALSERLSSYEKPMKDFLSDFMAPRRNPPDAVLEAFRARFATVCHAVRASLGPRPFHVRTGLNAAVFDAVSVAFSSCASLATPSDIQDRYRKLIKHDDFYDLTTTATTDVDTVKGRIAMAKRVLFDCDDAPTQD